MAADRDFDFVSSEMSQSFSALGFGDQEQDDEANISPFNSNSLPEEVYSYVFPVDNRPSAYYSTPNWQPMGADTRLGSIHPYMQPDEFHFMDAPPNVIHAKNFGEPYSASQRENVSPPISARVHFNKIF